jgi:hypothetical protein
LNIASVVLPLRVRCRHVWPYRTFRYFSAHQSEIRVLGPSCGIGGGLELPQPRLSVRGFLKFGCWRQESNLCIAGFRSPFDDLLAGCRATWLRQPKTSVPCLAGSPFWLIGANIDFFNKSLETVRDMRTTWEWPSRSAFVGRSFLSGFAECSMEVAGRHLSVCLRPPFRRLRGQRCVHTGAV